MRKKKPGLPSSDLQVPLDIEAAREYLARVVRAEEDRKTAYYRLQEAKYALNAAKAALDKADDNLILARAAADRACRRVALTVAEGGAK